jgi:hypothetical protein
MGMSDLEATMAFQIRAAGLPEPEREVCIIDGRKLRWDFIWRDYKCGMEVQGGIWGNSKSKVLGHNSGTGIIRDAEKHNLALLSGWKILLVTEKHIKSGEALKWIQQLLQNESRNHVSRITL